MHKFPALRAYHAGKCYGLCPQFQRCTVPTLARVEGYSPEQCRAKIGLYIAGQIFLNHSP
jgi:hypothetical protein